ncbi:MAG: TraR/DksA family transcriptional regulator [Gammaproteobacteria bacterium]
MTALSPTQSEELGRVLAQARNDVVAQIRSRLESSDDPNAVSLLAHLGQPDDMAQAAYLGHDQMALLGQEQGLLRDIDSAIERQRAGAANVCEECGCDIPFERLLAVPTARTCVKCQEQMEKDSHATGGPTM